MVRHPTCMILSNQLGHTEYGCRDALCTPVLLSLLQGRLPRRLHPGRRARRQKLHCRALDKIHAYQIRTSRLLERIGLRADSLKTNCLNLDILSKPKGVWCFPKIGLVYIPHSWALRTHTLCMLRNIMAVYK